jgi:dCMP deaminase
MGEAIARPDWDAYYLRIAAAVAERASCRRRRVGAVLVLARRIVATGYNGAPPGLPHCIDAGRECLRERMGVPSGERHELCYALHAEQNAVIQAARVGESLSGAVLYVTTTPCSLCARVIVSAGIREVVVPVGADYPDALGQEILGLAHVALRRYGREEDVTQVPDIPVHDLEGAQAGGPELVKRDLLKTAPWDAAQRAALRVRQQMTNLHPYTCVCGCLLTPITEGWYCEHCQRVVQTWAYRTDTDLVSVARLIEKEG